MGSAGPRLSDATVPVVRYNSWLDACYSDSVMGGMNFGNTQWTVVDGARNGDMEQLEKLFQTYITPIRCLIASHRSTATRQEIDDLVQEFCRVCLRRDFLRNVDRSKGRFRHFLQVCLRNFLRDDARRPDQPVEDAAPLGNGTEPNGDSPVREIEVGVDDTEEWRALDEPWALKIQRSALQFVDRRLAAKGRPEQVRGVIVRRLRADETDSTLPEEAISLGIASADLTTLLHRSREAYREFIQLEIARQVSPSEIAAEQNYLIEVLARIKKRSVPGA